MSALNSTETEALRNAMAILDYVLLRGFDPKAVDDHGSLQRTQAIYTKANLKKAKDELNTVIQVKGHYSNS